MRLTIILSIILVLGMTDMIIIASCIAKYMATIKKEYEQE